MMLCLFLGGAAGSPSNTMSPGLMPTSLPSGILIYPAVWPQHMGQKLGRLCPFGGGTVSRSNTTWPWPRPISVPSGILIHSAIWPQYMGQKVEAAVPFLCGEAGSPSNTMSPVLRPTSSPTGTLIHPAVWLQYVGRKVGGYCASFLRGWLGPHLTQCRLGRGLPPYKVSS